MPKIDKNYLTPEFWEEMHSREILILWHFDFQQSITFVLAAMLEGIPLPSNMTAKTTFVLV